MPLDEELPELSAGRIIRSLLIFPAVVQKGSAVFDHLGKDLVHRPRSQRRVVVEIADELAAEHPHVVNVFLDRLWRQIRCCQVLQKWTEQRHQLLAGRQIFLQAHPRTRPAVQIPALVFDSWSGVVAARFILVVLAVTIFHFMLQLITILIWSDPVKPLQV